jgi:hypothetical protein
VQDYSKREKRIEKERAIFRIKIIYGVVKVGSIGVLQESKVKLGMKGISRVQIKKYLNSFG